jgi:hypothetical protein
MTEEVGTSTVFSWTLIVIVVLTTILVVNVGLYGDTKDNIEEFFDLTEIKKIAEDVSNTEDDINLREANRLADYLFGSLTKPELNDCIFDLEFNEFEEGLIVEFKEVNERSVFRILDSNGDFLTRRNLNKLVYFTSEGIRNFIIKDFNEIEIGDETKSLSSFSFYKSLENNLFLLNLDEHLEIKHLKDPCDDILYIKDVGEGIHLSSYLLEEIYHLGERYEVYRMISNLVSLNEGMSSSDGVFQGINLVKKRNLAKELLINQLEEYNKKLLASNSKDRADCWTLVVNGYSFGGYTGDNKISYESSRVILSDGNILNINLMVNKDGCLPANELDKLEILYRGSI